MIEEIATKKDIKSEVAMDDSMADGHVETFPTSILETSAVATECQRETGETEGGGGKTKAHHEEEEDRGRKNIPTPVLETSAVAPVCQRETGETEGGDGKTKAQHDEDVRIEADVKEDIRRKESNAQRKRDSFTHVPETWAVATESQRETREKDGDSKGKDQDGVCNQEAEQISKSEDDGHVGHEDPKDVITTCAKEDNGCETHEIEEVTSNHDIKEVVMDDTTKDDEGQAGQEDLKSVPWDDISTSNNKDNNIKIVISNVRLYDE